LIDIVCSPLFAYRYSANYLELFVRETLVSKELARFGRHLSYSLRTAGSRDLDGEDLLNSTLPCANFLGLDEPCQVRGNEVPFTVRLLKPVAPDGDFDWVITNDRDETLTAHVAEESSDVRGHVEERHRGRKQLTGSENVNAEQPGRSGITWRVVTMRGSH
jgi:hypothetical protein